MALRNDLCRGASPCHQLLLGDNMAVCLVLGRSQASDFDLLVQVRRWSALLLAAGPTGHVRWIPSERNLADGPSRAQASPAGPPAPAWAAGVGRPATRAATAVH